MPTILDSVDRTRRTSSQRNIILLGEHDEHESSFPPPLKRDVRKRATAHRQSRQDLSNTQQLVYLSTGTDISGLKMKSMAMKMRHKLQRQSSAISVASSGQTSHSHSLCRVEEGGESDVRLNTSPSMRRMIALRSILYHPFSFLLVAFPLGIWAGFAGWSSLWVFWLNIVAMIPLAKILGDATEELADAIQNDAISGLLNATLGNAVEMILTVQTIRKGLLDVVKATLLGSVLSNLLLVLGTSFFLGGLSASNQLVGNFHVIHTSVELGPDWAAHSDDDGIHPDVVRALANNRLGCITMEKEQLFTVKGALVNISMHLLSILTVALPTVLGGFRELSEDDDSTLILSRCGALVITSSYIAYLAFHLGTHRAMLSKEERGMEEDDEDNDKQSLAAFEAVFLMVLVTVMIGVSSEFLVESMEDVVDKAKIPSEFIGVILLPIAGNACEHASAVRFAMIDRPGLTIGIAMGSATQISLLVVPFAVITGWILDKPMDLNFGIQDLTILFLSTLVVLALVLDGRSNWLKGFLLCNAYIFISLLYWFIPS